VSGAARTPEVFFDGHPDGIAIYRGVIDVIDGLGRARSGCRRARLSFERGVGSRTCAGPVGMSTTTFPSCRRSRYPPDKSKRFKSVVHPSPKVWMHHLEVRDPDQVDDEVARWLRDAYHTAS
jgi:Domain of unknown function (DUF5655)